MNKISSTGLNLVSKSVKENIEQTKSIQKDIINNQQDIINSNFTFKNFQDIKVMISTGICPTRHHYFLWGGGEGKVIK